MATTGVDAIGGSTIGDIGTTGDANRFNVTLAAGTTYQFDLQGSRSGQGTPAAAGFVFARQQRQSAASTIM